MAGINKSTCLLAPPSKSNEKRVNSGKYTYVCTCSNGQTYFLNASHFYIENGTKINKKYANNATKLKSKWVLNNRIQDIQ